MHLGGGEDQALGRRRAFAAQPLLLELLFGDRFHPEERLDDGVLDALLQGLEELVALFLVLLQGVALTVAAQADSLLEMVQGQQVVLPGEIDVAQHDVAFEHPEELGAQALLLVEILRLDHRPDLLGDLAVRHLGEFQAAGMEVDVVVGEDLFHELGERPFRGLGLLGAVRRDQGLEDVLAHADDVVAAFGAVEDVAAQLVDRLALLVHHIVVLEQVLAGLEVAPFDLLLGAFDGPRDHVVLDRLALFHAEAAHQALDSLRTEEPHEVVFERHEEA